MTWWVWVVTGWAVVSLGAALLLGRTSREISRQDERDHARRTAGSLEQELADLGGPARRVVLPPEPGTARRRVLTSRPSPCAPPAVPLHTSRPATSFQRNRPACRPGGCTPPTAPLPARGTGTRPLLLHGARGRSLTTPTAELARRRTLRATPSPDRAAAQPPVPGLSRRVRTPPPPAPARLANPHVRRALLLSCVPVIALAPLLASSTSSLGMHEALAAEIRANPEQAVQLIAALDRGRVLAGLPSPVTAPGGPAPLPAAVPSPAPSSTWSTGGSPTAAPTPTGAPSSSPGTVAPAEPTRTTVPQPPPATGVRPGTVSPSPRPSEAPSSGGEQVAPRPTPSVEPTPTPTSTPTPTPSPTPSPTEPTPTPEPSPTPTPEPSPSDPTPTQPTPIDPTPTDPQPTPTTPSPSAAEPDLAEPRPGTAAPGTDTVLSGGDETRD